MSSEPTGSSSEVAFSTCSVKASAPHPDHSADMMRDQIRVKSGCGDESLAVCELRVARWRGNRLWPYSGTDPELGVLLSVTDAEGDWVG